MSITIISLIIGILTLIFQQLEIDIAPEKIQNFVEVGVMFVSMIVAWYGRVRVGDINVLGGKK